MSEFSQNFMKWCGEKSNTFIETGTFKGTTTKLASRYFKKTITIEIDETNHNYSKNKLNNIDSIQFELGDTLDLLPKIIKNNKDTKCTFWLDAHPMDPEVDKSCPLLAELDMINELSDRKDHIIIIDDFQRCKNSIGDYPYFEEIKAKLLAINPNYIIKTLPFKAWQVKKGEPAVISASVEDFEFKNSFYINKGSSMDKYMRRIKSIFQS